MMSPPGEHSPSHVADDLFRREGARLVASLAAHLGTHRLQLAEDVVQEALLRALQTWPYRGIPDNPSAWLTRAAKNLALDALRREQTWQRKEAQITVEQERWLVREEPADEQLLADDTLRMLFICFHPQLSIEAQLAIALRTVCGLSPAEIGAALLTSEAAISKRLVRTRQLIRDLALPFAVPEPDDLPARLDGVLGTLYLLFNEGYKASSGELLVREGLCHEAIRLVTLLVDHPSTRAPRTFALLALMLLNAARLGARTDDAGNLLRLHEQDRSTWDQAMIQRGIVCLGHAAQGNRISEYHLEAGIAACHSAAPDDAATNWPRILSLYDQLVALTSSPVAAMNRAVAVSRVHGPQAGMTALDAITDSGKLESSHLFHVIRGTFAVEQGDQAAALLHFRQAGALASQPAERDFIARRVRECETPGDEPGSKECAEEPSPSTHRAGP